MPVWWEGDLVSMDGHGRGPYRAWQNQAPALLVAPGGGRDRQEAADRGTNGSRLIANTRGAQDPGTLFDAGQKWPPRLLQESSTQIDDAGQSRTRGMADPRLFAGARKERAARGYAASRRGGVTPDAGVALLIQKANGRGPYEASMSGDKALSEALRTTTLRGGAEGGGSREGCGKGTNTSGAGGIVDPGTIAERADLIRARLVKASGGEAGFSKDYGTCMGKGWRLFGPGDIAVRSDADRVAADALQVEILNTDALSLTLEWAPRLGKRASVYLDPPYQGATGYPVACARDEVLRIAETWARHGARVVLSEAVGLAAELGAGWEQAQLRAMPKAEWVTVYGCGLRAILPPLLRACAP